MAWFDTLTAGKAILSCSLKSLIVLIAFRFVTSIKGMDCTAESARTSFGVPAVLAHNVASPGTPVTPKFICPLNNASISDCVPPKVL